MSLVQNRRANAENGGRRERRGSERRVSAFMPAPDLRARISGEDRRHNAERRRNSFQPLAARPPRRTARRRRRLQDHRKRDGR